MVFEKRQPAEPNDTQENNEPVETDPLNVDNIADDTTQTPKGCMDRLRELRSAITLEPMVIFFFMSVMLGNLSTQNLNLEKACRVNLNFSTEVCDALERRDTENYTYYEAEVQKLTASVAAWKSVIQTSIPCTLILFVGAWSDKTGRRKICIILPVIGELLTCISNMVNYFFFYELSLEFLAFTEAIFPAMTGGWCTMFLGVFSYISDVTTEKSRTFRMGMVNFCLSVGIPIGMSLSGILLKRIGFYGVFSLSATMHCISLTYGIFFLKDPKRTAQQEDSKGQVKFFDFRHVRDTLGIAFTLGPVRRRVRICLLLGIVCMLFGPMYGEITILYLSTRFRFNWDALDFSMYLTYNFITHTVGTVFSLVVISKILQWHDSVLGIISTFSKIVGAFVYAFAVTGRQFYIGPMVEILNGTSLLALRSIMSKIVESNEQGKVNSVVGLAETMMPIMYAPLYSRLYMATIEVLPGAVFLLSAALTTVPALAFIYLFVEHRIGLRKRKDSAPRTERSPSLVAQPLEPPPPYSMS